jgi:hypothetical protein
MTEKRSTQRKEIKRHSVTSDRYCSLRVVSRRNLVCSDQYVRIIDLSVIGMGVECEQPIEPGIIWFKEGVYGQKCGCLVWQRRKGSRYRLGIEFISLSRFEEEYLRQQLDQADDGALLQDPEEIIAKVIAYITNERAPVVNLT